MRSFIAEYIGSASGSSEANSVGTIQPKMPQVMEKVRRFRRVRA